MTTSRRSFLSGSLGVSGAALLMPFAVNAGTWPDETIEAIVGHKPGGGTDGTVRLLAPHLEALLGAPRIRVSNIAGATGSVAASHVLSQPPDGYHWLFAGGFLRGSRAMGFDDAVGYEDWQFYGADASIMSFAVLPDSPIRDIEDLIRRGVDEPDTLTMSTAGIGGTWHLAALLVMRATGARFRIIPYGGGKPATVAAIQGEVDVVCSGVHEQIGSIKAGQLRSLGTGAAEVQTVQGEVLPTILDALPSLADNAPIGGGTAMSVRRDTDQGTLVRIRDAWTTALDSEEMKHANVLRGRFPGVFVGEAADRRGALLETVAANLLAGMGIAKRSPAELGLPTIEEFDSWWPPKGYTPRL